MLRLFFFENFLAHWHVFFLLVFGSETQHYTVEYIHVREYIYEYRNLLIFL